MISVERSVYEKFPRLADGRARAFARPVVELLRRVACEERINATLRELDRYRDFEFVEQVLQRLQVDYSVANTEPENIPVEGGVLIVANHPLGALDALTLLQLVGGVRRDVRILANDVLGQLEPLRPLLLPVNVFGGQRAAPVALRAAYRALEAGQAVIVFPAGEVSRVRPTGVRDGRWSDGFVRMACRSGVPLLPVHITAQNSALFYGLSLLARPLSALLLAREMFGSAHTRVGFRIGQAIPPQALQREGQSSLAVAAAVRRHVYGLVRRRRGRFPTAAAVAHPEPPLAVRRALRERAEVLGETRDGKRILLLDAAPGCPVLREVGRLRELAFRRVGEGTGTRRDLDRFDAHYRHLVLWDEEALAVVGAYRLGEAGAILRQHGMDGLYSASLFDYAAAARPFLDQAVELGRSFVQPAYWGSRSLDYLWQGIGAYLRRHPEVRWLLGPVSLSASLPAAAREAIVAGHRQLFGDAEGLARARHPFRVAGPVAARIAALVDGLEPAAALAALRQHLADLGVSVPTLYRQYVDLCEPDGVRFLDFGLDPAFGACVDGLIRVDLARLKPAKRSRYLGAD